MTSDIAIITIKDPLYPRSLKEINDPPSQIYIRGRKETLSQENLLAVIGSRKANNYGKQCVQNLLPEALQSGVVVVSGLAYGIDSLSHQICVDKQLPTIAVLGSGIDDHSIYPRSNISLARKILECGGVIMSEYPAGTKPLQYHFPERNRIIAGLCKATLIIQAALKSGSLITARLALEYNRDVLAVPGPINDKLSGGTNSLIREGASAITCSQDILDIYGLEKPSENAKLPLDNFSDKQLSLINLLSKQPIHIDKLSEKLDTAPSELSAIITELELGGYIENTGGMKYVRN